MGDARGISVALLAVPETTASTLYGLLDLFASTCRDWQLLKTGVPGPGAFDVRVVSRGTDSFVAANGVTLRPDVNFTDCPQPDIVCIPELLCVPDCANASRYKRECRWLQDCYARGSTLASICSGAVLLAEAGLLDDQDATTHWAFCEMLAANYPQVRVHPDQALVVSGEGQRLIMAGGMTSWQDLALYLVGRWIGIDEAMRMARIFLVDWHQFGQQPYALLTTTRQVGDAVIVDSQEWLARHYDTLRPVRTMVKRSGLGERTFKRRFKAATGMAPMIYLHTLRLEEAKQMLEASDLGMNAIALELGYEDASFFNRLFRRKVGMTPGRYRKRFGRLRAMLAAHTPPGAASARTNARDP